jgi:hypothetical protein
MNIILNPRVLLSIIPPVVLIWIISILWRERKQLSATLPIIFGIVFLGVARILDVFIEYPSLGMPLNLSIFSPPVSRVVNSVGDLADSVGVFLLILGFIQTIKNQIKQKEHIRDLETLLPICADCKKIRKEDNTWESIESYLEHTGAPPLTHGICPECKAKML